MKSFIAVPALFALSVIAGGAHQGGDNNGDNSNWAVTWTFSNEHSTWTSCSTATEAPATTPEAASSAPWNGPGEWTSGTSYTAVYSSGASTWAVPTAVSYSAGESWTSMIPATPATTMSEHVPTPVAPESTKPVMTTPAPSAYTGAAVNHKAAGMGAVVAVAGLALVL